MSYKRNQFKARQSKRFAFLCWRTPADVIRWRGMFNWSDEKFNEELQKAEEEYRRQLPTVGSCPGRFVYRELDYSGPRYVIRDKDAKKQLRDEAAECECTFIRIPVLTRKGMF